jgi:hypothetical protein
MEMNLLFWGITTGVIGEILVAIAILRVHHIMAEERRIDARVIRSFSLEKLITLLGVSAIVIGYFMEVYFYGLTPLLTCHAADCAAALGSAVLSQ